MLLVQLYGRSNASCFFKLFNLFIASTLFSCYLSILHWVTWWRVFAILDGFYLLLGYSLPFLMPEFLPSQGHPYHTEGLTCLAITSDSTLALTGSKDSSVHVVNITTGKVWFLVNPLFCSLIFVVVLLYYWFRKVILDS